MTTSFKTCLTPEEHIHRYGTLAPEQAAEFMESLVDASTAREVADLLSQLDVLDPDEFDGVLVGIKMARLDEGLAPRLRGLIDTFSPDNKAMLELLEKIEEDQDATNSVLEQLKADVEALRDSTVKFASDLQSTLNTVDDKLGV